MIQKKENILSIIRRNQRKIEAFGVKKLGLFGSFVRKEQKPQSDIDLLVEFQQGEKTFDNFMHLSFFLEEVLKHNIELVTTDSLSPYIKPYIVKEVEYVISSS